MGVCVRPSYIFKSPDSANCATIQIRPRPPVPSYGNHLLDGKYPTFSAVSISVFRITAMAMKTRIQTSDEVVDVGGGLLLLAGFLYWFGLIGGPVHHPAGPAWSSENQKQEDQKNNHLTKIQRKRLQYHDNKTRHGKLRSRVNVTEGFVSEREQQVRLGKQNKQWKYQNSPLCHFSCKDSKIISYLALHYGR